jgi:hypothetical protein
MPQSDPTRAAVAEAVGLPLRLGLLVLGLLVLGLLVLGLGLPLAVGLVLGPPVTTGPAPPVGVAERGGAVPQAAAANAMVTAITAHRTCVLRRECSRMKNDLAPNRQAQAQRDGTIR